MYVCMLLSQVWADWLLCWFSASGPEFDTNRHTYDSLMVSGQSFCHSPEMSHVGGCKSSDGGMNHERKHRFQSSWLMLLHVNVGFCVVRAKSLIVRSRTVLRHTRCRHVVTFCKASVTVTTVRTVTSMSLLMLKSAWILLAVTATTQIQSVNSVYFSLCCFLSW